MTGQRNNDEAMLAYLEGDDDVRAAAVGIWAATGRLLQAQNELDTANDAYKRAIVSSGIPEPHRERLGAALILRLVRQRLLGDLDNDEQPDSPLS